MNELMLTALVAVIVAAYARAKVHQQTRLAGKWGRFFDTGAIRRM